MHNRTHLLVTYQIVELMGIQFGRFVCTGRPFCVNTALTLPSMGRFSSSEEGICFPLPLFKFNASIFQYLIQWLRKLSLSIQGFISLTPQNDLELQCKVLNCQGPGLSDDEHVKGRGTLGYNNTFMTNSRKI